MKKFIVLFILLSLFARGANAQTHIQMPAGNEYYEWDTTTTFIFDKPMGFGTPIWYINGTFAGIEDSLVFIATAPGSYYITANWMSNVVNVNVNLTTKSKPQSLYVCVDNDAIDLNAIVKGMWTGTAVAANKFYPIVAGAGTYVLTAIKVSAAGASTEQTLLVTVYPPPVVMIIVDSTFAPKDKHKGIDMEIRSDASAIDLTPYGQPNGGTFTGKGVANNHFEPRLLGKGVYQVLYKYTHPTSGCSSTTAMVIEVQ